MQSPKERLRRPSLFLLKMAKICCFAFQKGKKVGRKRGFHLYDQKTPPPSIASQTAFFREWGVGVYMLRRPMAATEFYTRPLSSSSLLFRGRPVTVGSEVLVQCGLAAALVSCTLAPAREEPWLFSLCRAASARST